MLSLWLGMLVGMLAEPMAGELPEPMAWQPPDDPASSTLTTHHAGTHMPIGGAKLTHPALAFVVAAAI